MATVKFDMRDPETKKVVDGWADDTEYTIRTGIGRDRAMATVIEPEAEEAELPEEEAIPASPGEAVARRALAQSAPT